MLPEDKTPGGRLRDSMVAGWAATTAACAASTTRSRLELYHSHCSMEYLRYYYARIRSDDG